LNRQLCKVAAFRLTLGGTVTILLALMTAQTNTERQQALIARRKAAGLKELRNLWCHPEDEKAIRSCARRLAVRRERQEQAK
jgi:hypothetical protein